MKLLVTSDWHDDAVTMGIPRRPELAAYVERMCRAARDEAVDLALFTGDFSDPGLMLGPLYESDAVRWFRALADATRFGLVAIAGNHDVVEVDYPLSTLSPAREALPRLAHAIVVAESPAFLVYRDLALGVLALPYVSRAWSDSEARGDQHGKGPEHLMELAFMSAERSRASGVVSKIVVIGHRTVPGARCGSESKELSRGRDLDLPIERIAALKPDSVFNGHYHAPQVVSVGSVEILIPGSPLSFTTDDPSTGKGYTIAEV